MLYILLRVDVSQREYDDYGGCLRIETSNGRFSWQFEYRFDVAPNIISNRIAMTMNGNPSLSTDQQKRVQQMKLKKERDRSIKN